MFYLTKRKISKVSNEKIDAEGNSHMFRMTFGGILDKSSK